ncbi:MAG TPA: DUF2232 domain-containing protein [Coriobacteriia bacterium]
MLNANATIIAIPLVAFALGWLTYRFGAAPAVALSLVGGALTALVGPALVGTHVLDGAYVATALLAVGPVSALLLKRYPAISVAVGVSFVVTAAFMLAPAGAQAYTATMSALSGMVSAITSAGTATDAAALKTATESMASQFAQLWPAMMLYTLGAGVVIGIPLVGRAGRMLGLQVNRYGPLADIDVSFHVVWPTIAGLALAAAGVMLTSLPVAVAFIGANLLWCVRPLLFIQGVAVFSALYRRMKAGRIARTIGLALLCLTELLVPSVSILGVVDLFMNLRKLRRARDVAPGSTE